MSWPLPQDFNEAVQSPAIAFGDADLRSGQAVVGPTGLPLPRSGNFADVYQIRTANNRDWAVKCFTRPVTGLEQRYQKVDEALRKAGLPFTIGFTFLNEGVMVHGAWRPAVKMEWVDGLQLNQVVRDQAGNPKVLDALLQMWSRLCKKLRESGIAHADLQHGNVLLVAGAKAGTYGLKLIDYDGMYTPSLANTPSGESGHPNYQHPQRVSRQVYSPDLDRFPHLVIATALKGLAVLGPKLWERYDTGDNLLFTEDDFRAPAASRLMKELWQTNDAGLQALVGHLAIACGKPIPQTPWLDQVAPEGNVLPLSPEQARNAAAALGVPPPASAAVVPVSAAEYGVELVAPPPAAPIPFVNAFSAFDTKSEPEFTSPRSRRRADEDDDLDDFEPVHRTTPIVPIAIAACALIAIIGVVGAISVFGGKQPDETVQNREEKKDEDKPREKEKEKVRPKPPDPDPIVVVKKKDPIIPPPSVGPVGNAKFDRTGSPKFEQLWEFNGKILINEVRLSWDGKWLLTRENSPIIHVFDARTGAEKAGFKEVTRNVLDFAMLDDGNVASWHQDDSLAVVWDPATGKASAKLPIGDAPAPPPPATRNIRYFDVSPDGHYSAVGYTVPTGKREPDATGRIVIHDTMENQTLGTLDVIQPILRFTSNKLLVADVDRIAWYTLPELKRDREFKIESDSGSRMLAVSKDASLVLATDRTHEPMLIDAATGKVVSRFPKRFTGPAGAISDNNRYVALCAFPEAGSPDRFSYIEVLDLEEGKVAGRFPLSGNSNVDVQQLLLAPDNSYLVAKRLSRHVQVVEMPKGLLAVAPIPMKKDPPPPVIPMKKDPPPVEKKDPPVMVPVKKESVPEADAIAKAEEKLHGMFKMEYAKSLPAERKALALKLLALTATEGDSVMRFVLLRDARDIFVEVDETLLASQALNGIIRFYTVDADAERLALFEKIKETAGNLSARKVVAELAYAASDVSMAKEDLAHALKYAQMSIAAAKAGNHDASFQKAAEDQVAAAEKSATLFGRAKNALDRFKSDPSDLDAAYSVGSYHCFARNRWDLGLPALAKGATGKLQAAAKLDLETPRTGPADGKVAEAWWDAAQSSTGEEKAGAEYRARYWYARALPKLQGDALKQARTRFGFKSGDIEYGGGLIAELTAKPATVLKGIKARLDPALEFDAAEFKAEGPAAEIQLKWSGVLAPQHPGRYRFILNATNPGRVLIDGKVAIDTDSRIKTPRRDVLLTLPDRPVPIVVEFRCQNTEKHNLKLLWSIPGTDVEELVPPEVFYHDRKAEAVLGKAP